MISSRVLWFLLPIIFMACNQEVKRVEEKIPIDLHPSRPGIIDILEFKDEFKKDTLFALLSDFNPNYRILAIRAFSDWKADESVDSLIKSLNDPVDEVRCEAAYALGQIGDAKAVPALMKLFANPDSTAYDEKLLGIALESVGKLADSTLLLPMATVDSYNQNEHLLRLGKTYGLFRFCLRGLYHEAGTDYMLRILEDDEIDELKIIAAQYLRRVPEVPPNFMNRLIELMESEKNENRKLDLIVALGKIPENVVAQALIRTYENGSQDVKRTILKTLDKFDYSQINGLVGKELYNSNQELSTLASELLISTPHTGYGSSLFQMGQRDFPWYIKANVYGAVNKYLTSPAAFVNINRGYIQTQISRATHDDQKLAYIAAYATNRYTAKRMLGYFNKEESHMFQIKLANLIYETVAKSNFPLDNEIVEFAKGLIESHDEAFTSIGAEILSLDDALIQQVELSYLEDQQSQLKLPLQVEAFHALKRVIEKKKGIYNGEVYIFDEMIKPVDFSILEEFSPDQDILIETSKGNLTMKMKVTEAPGAVANFLNLMKSGYFQNKRFHRVVPNFVVQTGDNRGDMYGSLDYTIRTETPNLHFNKPGLVGMASAGRNTESSQWFITLAPALHLDGNYSIFGEITSGLEILNQLTTEDEIRSVKLNNIGNHEEDPTL